MNGFSAADMSTAAANGFRDGLAAQPAAAQEAVAVWTVTREGDPTFPRAYFSEAAADAMVAHITLAPFAVKRAPVAAAPVDLGAQALYMHLLDMLGAKNHIDAGRIIAELHASSMSTPTSPVDAHTLASAVEKALGWREGKRDAELDSLLEQAVEILNGTPAAPGIDLATAWAEGYRSGVTDERISESNIGIAGVGAKIEPARANPYMIDASPKGGSDAPVPDTFFVMDCPGYPGGYHVHPNTLEYALKFIAKYGNEKTRLATWCDQYQRRDYTAEEVHAMQATSAEVGS